MKAMRFPVDRSRGFTLLEVLVAAAITAFIGAISVSSLLAFVNVQERTRIESQEIFKIQAVLLQFERDVKSYAPTLTRTSAEQPVTWSLYLDPLNPLQDYELLRMSVQGEDVLNDGGWRIAKVAWGLDEDQVLWRDYWPYAEAGGDGSDEDLAARRRVMLEGVENVQFYVWTFGNNLEQRRREIFVSGDQSKGTLYFFDAMEMVLQLEDGSEWRKVVAAEPERGGSLR